MALGRNYQNVEKKLLVSRARHRCSIFDLTLLDIKILFAMCINNVHNESAFYNWIIGGEQEKNEKEGAYFLRSCSTGFFLLKSVWLLQRLMGTCNNFSANGHAHLLLLFKTHICKFFLSFLPRPLYKFTCTYTYTKRPMRPGRASSYYLVAAATSITD